MAKTLYKYEASSNKFVWFTTWDRALRNYYTDDYDYVPDPVVGNPFNTYVEFISRKPGMANVDWGDGIKEQAPEGFVKGQSNGSPATPMEKIYVLKNNYAQKWTIKPA